MVDFALDCKFPNDLDAAFREFETTLADRITANKALLKKVDDLIISSNVVESMAEIQQIFENLLRQGEGDIRNFDDVARNYGTPVFAGYTEPALDPNLTPEVAADRKQNQIEADEKMVFDAGGILHDGVWYLDGQESQLPSDLDNIEILRRLYYAVGQNLGLVDQIFENVRSQSPDGILADGSYEPMLFQSKLIIDEVPAIHNGTQPLPIEDVRNRYGLPEYNTNDENLYQGPNNVTYLIRSEYIGLNKSKKALEKKYQVPSYDLITQTVHPNKKELRPERVRWVSDLGYDTAETGLIFRFNKVKYDDSVIADQITANQNTASEINQTIEFFLPRLEGTSPVSISSTGLDNLKKNTITKLRELSNAHRKSISDLLFLVVIVKDIDVLINLKQKHTDAEIERLLEQRPEIVGIDFSGTVNTIQKDMNRVRYDSQNPSNKVSTNYMKRDNTKPAFNKQTLLAMYAELDIAITTLENSTLLTVAELKSVQQNLVNYGAENPQRTPEEQAPPAMPFVGLPSGSVASVMSKVIDLAKSFNLDQIIDDLQESITICEGLGGFPSFNLGAGLRALTANLKGLIFSPCASIIQGAASLLNELISSLDSFLRNILALLGGGSFEASLLNCLALKFELPDFIKTVLDNLLCFLASLLNEILQLSSDWIADLLHNILCVPIQILNALLSTVNEYVPRCISFGFELCDEVIAGLQDIKALGDMCSANISGMNSDLGAMSLQLSNITDGLNGFAQSANCAAPANALMGSLSLG